jgi:hypothetical protein
LPVVPPVNVRDLSAGLIFTVIGALFALGARNLEIGTAFRMGPGYFPLVLAGLLMVLGVVITARSFGPTGSPIGAVPWRGMILILAAPTVFGLTVRGLGLVAAIAIAVLIAAFASRRSSIRFASLLTLGLTAFCVLVFSYGLGLPLRLRGPWLNF